jgi:Ca2+-binding EF-hand superfamily protein
MCRLDADGDGKISYQEFIDIFFPYKDNYSISDTQIKKDVINNYSINEDSNIILKIGVVTA